MLRDIRQSQSERQLQERLNHLEMENDDLRKRASEGYVGDMFSQSHWMFRTVRRRGRRGGVVAGIIVGAFVASAGSELSFAFGPIPLIVGLVLVALFVRSIRRER